MKFEMESPKSSRASPHYGYPTRLDDFDEGKPLTIHSTKGKTPAEAALVVMKYVHKEMGFNVNPTGFSSLDKLYSLRTEPALDLLLRFRWSDFFEGRMNAKDDRRGNTASNKTMHSSKFSSSKNLPTAASVAAAASEQLQTSIDHGLTDDMFQDSELRDYFFVRLIQRAESMWATLKISHHERDFYREQLCSRPPAALAQCRELARYLHVLNSHRCKTIDVMRSISQREHAVMKLTEYTRVLQRRLFQ